ncbi:hypothetical protein FNV43_RR13168 [Rhamnella rubrinervis]|uniref:Uncharacterized protein n=1 Tax=Rhamnella rubrinervis TaxID=2594499 RepID=A0A8K0H0N0_9ROSA|nr:hypothetical protein FNV43_RR13168 [Rhamnella rubrinervis]
MISPAKKRVKRYSPYKGIGFTGKKFSAPEENDLLDVEVTETYSAKLMKGVAASHNQRPQRFAPPILFPGSKFSRARKARLEIERMLVEVVRKKRKQTEERELQEGEEGGMLLLSLHDTTSFAISMTFKILSQHPNCYSLLLQGKQSLTSNTKDSSLLKDGSLCQRGWEPYGFYQIDKTRKHEKHSLHSEPVYVETYGCSVQVLWTTYGTHYSAQYFQDPYEFQSQSV